MENLLMETGRVKDASDSAVPLGANPARDARWSALAGQVRVLGMAMAILAVAGAALFVFERRRDISDLASQASYVRRQPGLILIRIEPVDMLRVAWPLALATAFWLLRWPRLARGAAITFLVLAVDRLVGLALVFEVLRSNSGRTPFRLLRLPELLSASLVWTFGAGFAFIAATGVLGFRAVLVDLRYRRLATQVSDAGERRRWLLGRFAVMGSLVFAMFLCGARLWDVYNDVLVVMPSIRRLVLRDAPRKVLPPSRADVALSELVDLLRRANDFQVRDRYRDVARLYPAIKEHLRTYAKSGPGRQFYRNDVALLANNLAWSLATTPDQRARKATWAVDLARKAVELAPRDGNSWNTLAVAHFRAGKLKDARAAFQESMRLREGGDSFDWFFLAMAHAETKEPAEARRRYDQAVSWMKKNRPKDPELRRFWAEAALALNIEAPEAHEPLPEPPRAGGSMRPEMPD